MTMPSLNLRIYTHSSSYYATIAGSKSYLQLSLKRLLIKAEEAGFTPASTLTEQLPGGSLRVTLTFSSYQPAAVLEACMFHPKDMPLYLRIICNLRLQDRKS